VFVAVLLGFAVVVLAWIARVYRILFFEAPLAGSLFVRACVRYRNAGDLIGARALVVAGRPSWLARAFEEALGVGFDDRGAELRLEELTAELHDLGNASLRPIRGLASLSSSLGMLFAILSVNGVGAPKGGLLALQAGLVQSLALEQALSCVAVGGATAMVLLLSGAALRRQHKRLLDDLGRLSAVFEPVAEIESAEAR
jgi:hypothetical protein